MNNIQNSSNALVGSIGDDCNDDAQDTSYNDSDTDGCAGEQGNKIKGDSCQ